MSDLINMKKIAIISILLITITIFAGELNIGKWYPETRENLEKLIEKNANKGEYVVFDWDYTSIYKDTQENLFRYQIDNLKFKMTPEEFLVAIRKDIPLVNFDDEFVNVNGDSINILQISEDLLERYTFLYNNYINSNKMSLEEIKNTEEFKDFRGKLAFLYEAIGGSFSHDISYPWVLYLFHGMTTDEVTELAKEANNYGLGEKIGKYIIESSDILTGRTGKVSYSYNSGLRIQSEIANLFEVFKKNGIEVYVVSASLQDIVKVFATDPSFGYNLNPDNIYGMRLEMNGNKYTYNYRKGYPQTQTKGKVETINRFIKPKHGYKDPILVAGDSSGDYNMLTEYPNIQTLLLMKRKGRLDNLANDPRAIIQIRNEETGLFSPTNEY